MAPGKISDGVLTQFVTAILSSYPEIELVYTLPLVRQSDKNPDFSDITNRLKTLRRKKNIFSHKINALADNGFYFPDLGAGYDTIRCYSCDLGLRALGNEDPLVIHARLSPYCSHVNERMGMPSDVIQELKGTSPCLKHGTEITEHRKPGVYVAAKYLEVGVRRSSFDSLSEQVPSANLDRYVSCGYYYTGGDNITRCAFCCKEEKVNSRVIPSPRHERWCIVPQ